MSFKKLFLLLSAVLLLAGVSACKNLESGKAGVMSVSKLSENVYSYDLGNDVSVISTYDVTGGLNTDAELVPAQNKGVCDGDNNVFLVKTKTDLVLVDAGYGDKNPNAALVKNMATANIKPADITKIIMTHMHPDHVGGLTSGPSFFGGTPVAIYPNATIYVNKVELDFWTQATLPAGVASALYYQKPDFIGNKDTFFNFGKSLVVDMQTAYGAKVKTFDNVTSTDAVAGVNAISKRVIAGHTPGHTGFLITGAKKMFIAADFVNCGNIQLDNSSVAAIYDYNYATATTSRKEVIKYLMDNSLVVAGTHLPKPGFVLISNGTDAGKYIFTPAK